MKKYLVSYATSQYKPSIKKLKKTALKNGIDKVVLFDEKDLLNTGFYRKNKSILDEEKGAGFWIWKPFFIMKVLANINEDDFLVYSDAGIEIVRDLSVLFDLCNRNNGILLFDNKPHLCKTWTKRDCFILMDSDYEKYYNAEQCMGGFMILQNKQNVISFLEEWQNHMEDIRIVSDYPSKLGTNLPEFVAHRHDQSVLSLLAVKYNIELFRDPSQWGNFTKLEAYREIDEFLVQGQYSKDLMLNSPYPTLINVHRTKRTPFLSQLRACLCRYRNCLMNSIGCRH